MPLAIMPSLVNHFHLMKSLKVEQVLCEKWHINETAVFWKHSLSYLLQTLGYFFSSGRRQVSPVTLIWITLIFLYIHHQHLLRRERCTHFLLAIRFMDIFSLGGEGMSMLQGQKENHLILPTTNKYVFRSMLF